MSYRIDQLLMFLKEIEKYKTVERKIWTSKLDRAESDAEHSWHMAMFIMLFKNELPQDADFTKMLKLALIHDLAEIYAGDTFAFDTKSREGKRQRESDAARRLFSQLPEDIQKEFMDLFREYENGETKEAKLVKSFDKIQPILQNICSEGKSWREYKINHKEIDDYKRKHITHDDFVMKLYDKLMEEAKEKKLI